MCDIAIRFIKKSTAGNIKEQLTLMFKDVVIKVSSFVKDKNLFNVIFGHSNFKPPVNMW